jgi:hypothetical protein
MDVLFLEEFGQAICLVADYEHALSLFHHLPGCLEEPFQLASVALSLTKGKACPSLAAEAEG